MTFDTARLRRVYQIIRHENDDVIEEREWRVVIRRALKPVRSYLRSVQVQAAEVEWFADLLMQYPNAGWGGETPVAVRSLLRDPLVHT